LRLVQTRATIIITDRGAPVATLAGIQSSSFDARAVDGDLVFTSVPEDGASIAEITFPKLQKSSRLSADWLRDERGDR
jgi:antitoxin (DNA-binding transcriptional repressor) of toxin-antitoxin stability system